MQGGGGQELMMKYLLDSSLCWSLFASVVGVAELRSQRRGKERRSCGIGYRVTRESMSVIEGIILEQHKYGCICSGMYRVVYHKDRSRRHLDCL